MLLLLLLAFTASSLERSIVCVYIYIYISCIIIKQHNFWHLYSKTDQNCLGKEFVLSCRNKRNLNNTLFPALFIIQKNTSVVLPLQDCGPLDATNVRSIRLTNQKIEFYKLTNQKMLRSIRSAM